MEQDKCKVCGRDAEFYSPYLKQHLCKKHFERMIIRRVSKVVTSAGLKSRGYRLKDDGSEAFRLIKFMFKEDKNSKVALLNYTMEDFAVEVLKYICLSINDSAPQCA